MRQAEAWRNRKGKGKAMDNKAWNKKEGQRNDERKREQ